MLFPLPRFMMEPASEPIPAPPLPGDIARRILADALDVLDNTRHFERGDIIRVKKGIETTMIDLRGGVAVYLADLEHAVSIEYIDPADLIKNNVAALCSDCIIGIITDDGALLEVAACSRYFELAPDQDEQDNGLAERPYEYDPDRPFLSAVVQPAPGTGNRPEPTVSMTLDAAQDAFSKTPTPATAAVYMRSLISYESDDMIGEETFVSGLTFIAMWMKGRYETDSSHIDGKPLAVIQSTFEKLPEGWIAAALLNRALNGFSDGSVSDDDFLNILADICAFLKGQTA